MGWKDMARVGRDWAEAKKTELLTTDNRTRDDARAAGEEAERAGNREAVTSLLEGVLPEKWAQRITDARPENVAQRQAEHDAQEAAERRTRLEAAPTNPVELELSGGETGSLSAALPVTVEERPADPADADPDGPPPLAWLVVRVEAPEPVAFGTTTLSDLSVAVPSYAGPGRYDLVDLMRRGEAGEIGWWEAFDLYLSRAGEADDTTWYADLSGSAGPAWIEVEEGSLRLDLPLQSAVSAVRLVGTVAWS
ncbi:hypothetical protein ACFQ0K_07020 [Nocardioides caeni]|uniref:Uncharacterized protein n=1 Tax=Nocardioides caeni TaxID=574700 RepID=A0A4S8N066_9ACTN|nr:hypothetical protein [Nocardioides caeni]THV08862.1 hypothetical protein E9934_18735 [Nocardioides caeni]